MRYELSGLRKTQQKHHFVVWNRVSFQFYQYETSKTWLIIYFSGKFNFKFTVPDNCICPYLRANNSENTWNLHQTFSTDELNIQQNSHLTQITFLLFNRCVNVWSWSKIIRREITYSDFSADVWQSWLFTAAPKVTVHLTFSH